MTLLERARECAQNYAMLRAEPRISTKTLAEIVDALECAERVVELFDGAAMWQAKSARQCTALRKLREAL